MSARDVFVGSALRIRGRTSDEGTAVLRPGYVVFAPKKAPPFQAAQGATGTLMPQAFHDLAAYVAYLQTLPGVELDATLDEAVRQCGWSRVRLGDARVVTRRGLFRRRRVTVAIEGKDATIRFAGPILEARLPDVESMLAGAWYS